ncbi:MAG: hypothetical protein MJ129_02335 [Clostridia bacterium]|nr:hypothetical protein [Clostridia bacterium]
MKMKKILALIMSLMMLCSFAACNKKAAVEDATTTTAVSTTAPVTQPEAEALPELRTPPMQITFNDFGFTVNDRFITYGEIAWLQVYKVELTDYLLGKDGVSKATDKETGAPLSVAYTGYKLVDILNACGITDAKKVTVITSDGYDNFGNFMGENGEVEKATYDLTKNPDYYIVGVEKDKQQSPDGTLYFAPVMEAKNSQYASMVTGFVVS